MHTAIQLPDAAYRDGERLAKAKGFTREQLIVHTLERELSREAPASRPETRISLPLLYFKQPDTLDLKDFNFDDLLA